MEKLLIYPYNPCKAGIPFGEILNSSGDREIEGSVIGDSGRSLNYKVNKHFISISDAEFGDRLMFARVFGGVATFGLQTKISDMDLTATDFPWIKHPDMFAKMFVGISLQYFKDMKNNLDICRGIWDFRSDNYALYRRELERTGDQVIAARNTWSGQTFIEYGFSEINEKDIMYGPLADDSSIVIADFHRPSNLKA